MATKTTNGDHNNHFIKIFLLNCFLITISFAAEDFVQLPEKPIIIDHYKITNRRFSSQIYQNVLDAFPEHSRQASLEQIKTWMNFAHNKIKYRDPGEVDLKNIEANYKPGGPVVPRSPEDVESTLTGDCKEKAIWLFNKVQDQNAAFVIGRTNQKDRRHHAWLYYYTQNQWWILDPTNLDYPITVESTRGKKYFPIHSLTAHGAYKHCSERSRSAYSIND